MVNLFDWVKVNYRELIVGFLFFSVFVIFETYQQLFYFKNFSQEDMSEVTFFAVLNAHLYRWLVWAVLSLLLILYSHKNPLKKDNIKAIYILRYLGVIMLVLLLNLIVVSALGMLRNDIAFSWSVFNETFVYFFFHKSPILFITLVALTVLVHFFRNREALNFTIGEVGKLKFTNQQLYEELKSSAVKDESFVLQVKTGSRTKLVPVENIVWIEADDYCVRIYDDKENAHTLRSSMKSLSDKLELYGFLRVHRKAIVNMSYVTEFVQNGKIELLLKNGSKIPVAHSRLADLKGALQSI